MASARRPRRQVSTAKILFDSIVMHRLGTDSDGVSVAAVRVLWFVVPPKAARSIRKEESGCELSPLDSERDLR